ncbi:MAG: hypothetical protein AAB654_25600 [Acidobacteriota bacterium]
MTRNQFLSGGAAGLAVPRISMAAGGQSGSRPKNVLFLLSDQHKPRALGLFGDPYARTPNLDALARSGLC